jgi:LPS sulfotransferase NodH
MPTDHTLDNFTKVLRSNAGFSVSKKILILSTPRSGSSYFCDKLSSTGLFGYPEEWLSPVGISRFNASSAEKINNIRPWWAKVQRTAVSSNGVFSCKLMIRQYTHWIQHGFDPLKEGAWDTILWVYRDSLINQAFSLAKARATNVWHSSHDDNDEQKSYLPSNGQVLRAMAELSDYQDYYQKKMSNRVHACFRYEDFATNESLLHSVLAFCGIASSADTELRTSLSIQRSAEDNKLNSAFKQWISLEASK